MEIDREDCHGDDADRATYFIESVIDDHVKDAMRRAAQIPEGVAGECEICGEHFARLVDGCCGFCRDEFGMK
jgi:hypothetical protein